MKIKFLMAGMLGLFSATAFAQKGELSSAQSNLEKYESLRNASPALSMPALNSAKASIDKAAANEKTAALPQTFALKGAIYASLAEADSVGRDAKFNDADAALKKAKELDSKGEFKKMIDGGYAALGRIRYTQAADAYKNKQYDVAFKGFDYYRQQMPEDTNAILYTGVSAYNSKNFPAAISNFSKLVSTKYSGGEMIYDEMLTESYLANGDTTGAMKALAEGVAKFPKSAKLRNREVLMGLQTGKQEEVLGKIEGAIANDPKNKELYYYAGLAYYQAVAGADKKLAGKPDAALTAKRNENFNKAVDAYKKALEIDPSYYDANLNLGFILSGPAIDAYNAANKLPGTAANQKKYDALMAKAGTQMDLAKPYLLKSVELQPKNVDALTNLRNYYKIKKDDASAAKISKQIKDAGGN